MKKYIFILLIILFVPVFANAETLEFNICKSGCEYESLADVYQHTELFAGNDYDVIINFNENEIYEPTNFNISFGEGKISSLTINGNNAVLNISENLTIRDVNNVAIKDLNINCNRFITENFTNLNLSNVSINANRIVIQGKEPELNQPAQANNKPWLNNKLSINNSSIKTVGREDSDIGDSDFLFVDGTIENSEITGFLICELSDIRIKSSKLIDAKIVDGFMDPFGTNIYIDSSTHFNSSVTRKKISREMVETQGNGAILLSPNGSLIEFDKSFFEPWIEQGVSPELESHIYFYQDINKVIKTNTNINEFESEFINTYKDGIGYDDIKDLPIEWKSEDESIATLDNGTIKPIAKGQVDLVGTRGNDIYTIHLTVDMPAKKTNEKKIRMAPSTKITLNSVFKDLDISSLSDDVWEISNPKVAKVVNGEIISLSKGETDIVATINGVKYVYHLTVSDTLVSKEVNVPITGKNIKLWIIVVTILLLSVIGACSYILIKKK